MSVNACAPVQAAILADARSLPEVVDLRDANNKLVARVTREQAESALAAGVVDAVGARAVKYIRLRLARGTNSLPNCTPHVFLQRLEHGRTWAFAGTTGADGTLASPVTLRADRRNN